jgi:hypothetical protein
MELLPAKKGTGFRRGMSGEADLAVLRSLMWDDRMATTIFAA